MSLKRRAPSTPTSSMTRPKRLRQLSDTALTKIRDPIFINNETVKSAQIATHDIGTNCTEEDSTKSIKDNVELKTKSLSTNPQITTHEAELADIDSALAASDWPHLTSLIEKIVQERDKESTTWPQRTNLIIIMANAYFKERLYDNCLNSIALVHVDSEHVHHLSDQYRHYLTAKCYKELGNVEKAKDEICSAMQACLDGNLGLAVATKLQDLLTEILHLERVQTTESGNCSASSTLDSNLSPGFILELADYVFEQTGWSRDQLDHVLHPFNIQLVGNTLQFQGRSCYVEAVKHAIQKDIFELASILTYDTKLLNTTWKTPINLCGYEMTWNTTTLNFAALYNRVAIMQLLMQRGANIKHITKTGHSCLHFAVLKGHIDTVNFVLRHGVKINTRDCRYGITPLHIAVMEQRSQLSLVLTKDLIRQGASMKAVARRFGTPVEAALDCGNFQVLKELQKAGLNVNLKDKNGTTLLHRAARLGNVEGIKTLVAMGANVNTKTCDKRHSTNISFHGSTPLHIAAVSYQYQAVMTLVDLGAEINTRDSHGRTTLHHVIVDKDLLNSNDLVDFHRAQCINHLISKGADVNAKAFDDWTPLHYAARFGSDWMIKVLASAGADINAKTKNGTTALGLATKSHGAKTNFRMWYELGHHM